MNNKLKQIINYLVLFTDKTTNQDICLMILYYNYMMLRDTNNPGIIINTIAYKTQSTYKYFLEDVHMSDILKDIIKSPIENITLSKEDKQYLDESIVQWRKGSDAFEELLNMVLHTKTQVTKCIIDLPRILFFACKQKSEYSVLLSRLTKMIEENGK